MIYAVMAVVLGVAGWQIVNLVRRAKRGMCASGCSGCGSNGHCPIQNTHNNSIDVDITDVKEIRL
ncbi:FeoB-associated Cys-rich membrane protein [Effusibacillus dendaii]|uniref:FeoB-associated Cys-rich membrane protein n=1 Tax=Effusibacillus dendaii TaxID=2743772 RepID=A0A7I8DD87_9BACL|nr:FeoB-associated Cys-rich membrane protein [Effusibacillus dendaii]BCJ88183.1 hypothetical protein skT53_31680 [Effusibacillus dendaii]